MIISLYKTFSGNEFVIPSIKSIYDYTDKIIMVHSDVSWNGERGNDVYPVVEAWAKDNDTQNKIEHIFGEWSSQDEQYKVGIDYIEAHYDPKWVQVIDTDEVWDKENAQRLFYTLRHSHEAAQCVTVKSRMFTYIKKTSYRIDPPEPCTPVVAFRWDGRDTLSGVRFNQTMPSALMSNVVFHHYSFVRRTWDDIKNKIVTSHIGDSEGELTVEHCDIDEWKTEKWDRLPQSKSLHPTIGVAHFWKGVIHVEPLEGVDGYN